MSEETKNEDDEISLIDLIAVLWRRKKMIIAITLIGAIGAVAFSIVSRKLPPEVFSLPPNQYTASAFMLIDNRSSGGGISSMMDLPATISYSALAEYLVGTKSLVDSVIDELDLTRYNIKDSPRTAIRNVIGGLKASGNERSGVFTISFTDIDPVFAKDVVNACTVCLARRFDELGLNRNKIAKENLEINIANTFQEILELEEESRRMERSVAPGSSFGGAPAITTEINMIALELTVKRQVYTQLKLQYELLKLDEAPVFQILEMVQDVTDVSSGPSRAMICIIVTLASGFFAVLLAFFLDAVSKIKNDPVAMEKLRGKFEK